MENLEISRQKIAENNSAYLGWIVCFSAALFPFYDFVQMNMFNAISTSFMQDFHLTAKEVGNTAAFYLYSTVIIIFPVGILLDRISTRKSLLFAVSMSITGTLLFSFSTNIFMAQVSRFMAGIGGSFSFLTVIMLTTRWFPASRLGSIIGMIVTMAMLGGVTAQTPLTILVDKIGWRHALWVDVLFGLIILWIIYQNVRDYPSYYIEQHQQFKHQRFELGLWNSILLALKNIQTWLCAWYTCLLNLPILLLGAVWGISFLVTVHHITREESSYVTSMIFIGTLVGSTLFGWISDCLGLRRLPMLFGAIASLILIIAIIYLPNLSFVSLLMLFFTLGLTTSSQVLSYPLIAESNSQLLTGAAEGIAAAVIMSGGAIFQPLFGWVMDKDKLSMHATPNHVYTVQDYHVAMLIFPIAFMISILLALFLKETHPREIR